MTDTDLAFASIDEIARLFRKRKLSPVELTKFMLDRIERLNPKLSAYLTVTADLAIAQAQVAEKELFGPWGRKARRDRGPLHGIPISLKDNIYTAGVRTTAGSKILKDFVPQHDAAVWTKLREAGAILLGKTNLHEFAYGVTTNNPHFGATRNPWDLDRIPGGSSGGSAAAVAAGLCYGSIGTDTGGSIRIPAALCGVVGLKPGIGRIDVEGILPLSRTLDFAGPLARSVRDAALLTEPLVSRAKKEPLLSALPAGRSRPHTFTLGLPKEFFFDVISPDGRHVFQQAVSCLRKNGVKFREVSIPLLNETESAGNQIAWAEATHFHQRSGWFPGRAADYGEDVRTRLEMGTKVSATAYLQALELRDSFIRQFHQALEEPGLDALAVPTTPISAPLFAEETTTISGEAHPTRALLLRLNRPANLAAIPAISVPCGFTSADLPVGLQFLGAAGGEHLLLKIAQAFELANPQRRRPSFAVLREPR